MSNFKTHRVKINSVHDSFERFWCEFHRVTCQNKSSDKAISYKLWESTINLSIKKRAYDNIHKELKCSAYQYLLKELRNY